MRFWPSCLAAGWIGLTVAHADLADRAAGWSSAPDAPSVRLVPGRTVVPALTGPALSNHVQCVRRLGQYPKQVPSEVRVYAEPASRGVAMRYYLFKPAGLDPGRRYPLVISLHGGRPRQFEHLVEGEAGFAYGLGRLVAPDEQQKHPAFVVAPWSGGGSWTEGKLGLVRALVEQLARQFPIDRQRIYVTGQSMGGYGTWAMLAQFPNWLAAAIPICGGGDPSTVARFKHVPIWAFHGTADQIVPVSETRQMIQALLAVGGQPIYWEYAGATHAQTAERAYCEPALLDWLFGQARR